MRIQVDTLDKPPIHALSVSDIKAILAVVPSEWNCYISHVRLSAALPHHSRFGRLVILSYPRLTICPRGLTEETAYKEVLRELAAKGMKVSLRMVHRLPKSDLQMVDKEIAPFLKKLLAENNTGSASQS